MTKNTDRHASRGERPYKKELRDLQIELVKLHRHVIEHRQRVLVIFEGRDAAGKDGAIKRIVEHLSPRDALGAESTVSVSRARVSKSW